MAHGLGTPEHILDAGWQGLVDVLDEGHYVRYDESTAEYLLDTCRLLLARYGGRVTNVLVSAKDAGEVTKRLKQFRGVGPVTTEIFLRDVDLRAGGDRAAGRQPIALGRENLERQTARELRKRARLLRIPRSATMSKQALVDSLAPYYAKE
jgi:hypothetical protein